MNLVELSEELEFMPKDALIQLSQNPNSNYPPYLVLAEIQRRTQMEKMYAAARPKPQNTVAEEVVTDFAMSTPNAGISMMDGSAPTERFSPKSSDIPAPVLMQTAASGGLTGYQNRGQTMIEQSLSNPEERGFFGRTFDYIKENPGTTALNVASAGLMFVPGVGLISLGLRGLQAARALNYAQGAKKAYDVAKRGAQATGKALNPQALYSRPNPVFSNLQQGTRRVLQKDGTYKVIDTATGKAINPRVFSMKRAVPSSIAGAAGLQAINYMNQDDKVINEMPPPERELSAEEKELLRLQNEMATAQTETKPKGFDDQALNLISLGGTIMGARNLSELGQGLTSFATAKQAAKGDEAQQAYYAASAAKAQAEVENMPLDRVLSSIEAITEQQEAALENNDTDTATALGLQLQILNQRALELQGIDVQTKASIDKNLIASFGT